MDPNDPRHGTHAGYQAHRKIPGETICEPCRVAARKYRNEHRAKYGRGARSCHNCGMKTENRECRTCRSIGAIRPGDVIDFDIEPPRWVRRGLIWVAA